MVRRGQPPPTPFGGRNHQYVSEDGNLSYIVTAHEAAAFGRGGTFMATPEEPSDGSAYSHTIQGTWVDNGDGTAALNYDHSTIVVE